MMIRTLFVAAFLAVASFAQSTADTLQKAIYDQETLGDLDSAITLYRQVATSTSATRLQAAQAQYQLVLCMLQKGDRAAAGRELDLLSRNYSDQQELIAKARKLVPGASSTGVPLWAEGEASELLIKRDGTYTGEYLYYSAVPWRATVNDAAHDPVRNSREIAENAQNVYLWWQLATRNSTRSIQVFVDRDSLRHTGRNDFSNDDVLGDQSALPFAGPAVDAEPLIFRMRMMPLAPGYKVTLTTLPFILGQGTPRPVELAVTGTESIQVPAGKFNCYKVAIAALGQTFWFGVDGAHPFVKFQNGTVEADLVKVWAPTLLDDVTAFLKNAGWTVTDPRMISGDEGTAFANSPKDSPFGQRGVNIVMTRRYAATAEIDQLLHKAITERSEELKKYSSDPASVKVRPETTRNRAVGGQRAVSAIIDYKDSNKNPNAEFVIFIRTESLLVRISHQVNWNTSTGLAMFQWIFDPILATAKIP